MRHSFTFPAIFSSLFLIFTIGFSDNLKASDNGKIIFSKTSTSYKGLINSYSSNPIMDQIDDHVDNFLHKWGVVGASVAIAKNGRMVYAKGFGYADRETGEPVKPGSLFRIASVSKLITATTIMHLVEKGELKLTDKPFGPQGILNDPAYQKIADPRVGTITINQLLNHTGGWNVRFGDPMFRPIGIARFMHSTPPADMNTIIRYVLGQKLSFEPGTRYHYSNFGYAVLGKIIEKITGMNYEAYVDQSILWPLGIFDMRIGKTAPEDRMRNEVKYYEMGKIQKTVPIDGSKQLVPRSYGNDIEDLEGAGGWIASAASILKLVVAIDGNDGSPDILSSESIKTMTDPVLTGYRPLGWIRIDDQGTWMRTGTMSGSSAVVVRQNDGVDWVVLFNSSIQYRFLIHKDMFRLMSQVISGLSTWPSIDLFCYYQLPPIDPIRILNVIPQDSDLTNVNNFMASNYGTYVYPNY
ncbi:MAG: serine hydrolase domain-containing protein [Bacteroidota bacterium]|nr:serine hydrolase domain-containing protein [Bacteroidota bacterium]MDP4274507.1 serine hydrolase domain-containing protein [Bacteroidota bacterium]